MIQELFNSNLFVWVMGILAGFILYMIKKCFEPKQLDNNVVRYNDVKKLISEKKVSEEKNINLIMENMRLQIGSEMEDKVEILVAENASLISQFISGQKESHKVIGVVISQHSEQLIEGEKTFKILSEKLEQLRLVMIQFLPPQAISSIINREDHHG